MDKALLRKVLLINREVFEVNMEEKSLTWQRIVYDTLQDNHHRIHEINLTEDHGKSCYLACQKYKTELERITNENKQIEKTIKQKLSLMR